MQSDGFNLEAISKLLDELRATPARRSCASPARCASPSSPSGPRIVTAEELAKPFGGAGPEELRAMLENALAIGFLHPLGDGRYEELSPRLAAVREELFRLGIAPSSAIEVGTLIRKHADAIARAFAELFLKEVWEPFDKAGRPEKEWPRGPRLARAPAAARRRGRDLDLRPGDERRRREGLRRGDLAHAGGRGRVSRAQAERPQGGRAEGLREQGEGGGAGRPPAGGRRAARRHRPQAQPGPAPARDHPGRCARCCRATSGSRDARRSARASLELSGR